jgi:hypothetical protein
MPIEFVYINRKALESDAASRQLHRWIDLTFGFQQRSEAAVAVFNNYKREMYNDIWRKDPDRSERRRRELETMIEQIGQVSTQLFTAPHASRDVSAAGPAA